MKRVLVPTDFSANSKVGVRFAINWATQQKLQLVFIHVLNILRPTSWTDVYFDKYADKEKEICLRQFEKFVKSIYKGMNVKPGKHSYVILPGIGADIMILDYCRNNKNIDYICIGTRGAGKFNKVFGTNTGNLITKSDVPVIAVPKNYKVTEIKNLLYSSDFRNYNLEIIKVIDFARPLKAVIDVLHFTWPDEVSYDEKTLGVALKKQYKYGFKIHFKKNDAVHSLIQNLEDQIRKRKPSIVVMFTNQDRTIFQRMFLSSKAEDLSFKVKVPLLVLAAVPNP